MHLEETRLDGKTVFQGRIVDVRHDRVLLSNGNEAMREVVEHPGGVTVLPVSSDGIAYMVRQFRYPYEQVLLEAPAGKLEPGEEPHEAALRELLEETGLTCQTLTELGCIYSSPGFSNETLYLYLAQGLSQGEAQPDENEILMVERVPFGQAVEQIMNGELRDAKTITAVLKTKLLLGL